MIPKNRGWSKKTEGQTAPNSKGGMGGGGVSRNFEKECGAFANCQFYLRGAGVLQ